MTDRLALHTPPRDLRGAARWLFSRSPYLSASVIALVLCCARDLFFPFRPVALPFLSYWAGLALVVGLLHGLVWSGLFLLLRSWPRPLALAAWPAASLGLGFWLARQLGAFTRLHSRYAHLAIAVLAACSVAGIALGAVCAGLQPTAAEPEGLLFARSRLWRYALALLLIASAVGLQIADRRLFANLYPTAHVALRVAALWTAMLGLVLALPWLPAIGRVGWLAAAVAYGLCLALLTERRVATLNAFDERPWAFGVLEASRTLVDFDRDGYAAFLGSSDCAQFNPRVHPGAQEIPDNGIDENCMLGDAKSGKQKFDIPPAPHEPADLDVVLITCDAWNPEHLGVYNPAHYGPKARATTPNLDRWAQNATVFDHAYTAGGWTSVAIPALLRGVYPRKLRWRKYYETNFYAMLRAPLAPKLRKGEQPVTMFPLAFDDPHPTLGEFMRARGMTTYAVTDDGYSAMLERGTGIERGFNQYREVDELPEAERGDSGTAAMAISFLRAQPEDRRFFLWTHFFGTHWPDETHPGTRVYGTRPTDRYDHEVAYLDSQLIRLLDAIAARKHPVAVFVTADHGEGLTAVTRFHGQQLDEPVIRIPLLARVPGWPAKRVRETVSSIDLVPTILSLVKAGVPGYLDGVDLAPIVMHGGPRRTLFADTWRYNGDQRLEIDYAASFDGTRKFVLDRMTGGLYSVSQLEDRATPVLVGLRPIDALSAAVFGYIEEAGAFRLSD